MRKRSIKILQLIANGKDPAVELNFSSSTIRREISTIFSLLDVNNRAHAVAEAFRRKLIE